MSLACLSDTKCTAMFVWALLFLNATLQNFNLTPASSHAPQFTLPSLHSPAYTPQFSRPCFPNCSSQTEQSTNRIQTTMRSISLLLTAIVASAFGAPPDLMRLLQGRLGCCGPTPPCCCGCGACHLQVCCQFRTGPNCVIWSPLSGSSLP